LEAISYHSCDTDNHRVTRHVPFSIQRVSAGIGIERRFRMYIGGGALAVIIIILLLIWLL
jgi:hypothetical protein